MLPSDINLTIRSGTVRYNNKILISDEKFSLVKMTRLTVPAIKCHKATQTAANSNDALLPHRSHAPNISHKNPRPHSITHNDEKIALVLLLAGGFAIFNVSMNRKFVCRGTQDLMRLLI